KLIIILYLIICLSNISAITTTRSIPDKMFIWDKKWLDINRWRCPFYNDGRFAYDNMTFSGAGTWPYPYNNTYVYGAGLWVGAISGNDTLVTVGYNPNNTHSEFFPTLVRYWREGTSNLLDRIYKYPNDWPPPLSRFPMAPQIALSNTDLWCCFSDSDPSRHSANGRPLGVDIALTIYGWSDTICQDFFILKYDVMNHNSYTLNDMYFGLVMDGDIGNAADDMVGLLLNRNFTIGQRVINVKNTGYIYDADNIETTGATWQSGTPGAVAIRLLATPGGLDLTAFKKFTLSFDPLYDKDQYKTMAGYNYLSGMYEPYDSVDITPGDKRILLSSGPFNLAPLTTKTFYYALIGAIYGAAGAPISNRDTTQLAYASFVADSIFQTRILGIVEEQKSLMYLPTINIYPNPAKTSLYVRLPLTGNNSILKIYDISGKLIKEIKTSHPETRISIKDINPGVYFLRLSDININKKLIITK
ncbi:MAG: T9SS type A sorting domain-containing protein, partial [candidate division WOR-3 bacterium]|nr:T9SS type A sorting domain-containing protein [candidate division WOR-3 bacterium]